MIQYRENALTVPEYLGLRAAVGWKKLSERQARLALKNCLYCVSAYDETGKLVGMGRIVGDGAVVCYIQDLIVIPSCHGRGIGSELIRHLAAFVTSRTGEDEEMMLDLMCAKGRETFYEKNGFTARPTPSLGPGMIRYIRKKPVR